MALSGQGAAALTLAFDVYGTLVDTAGVAEALGPLAGERAAAFARRWRAVQLEYSFRRALMRDYRDFAVCIAQAFDAVCLEYGLAPGHAQREALLALYRSLPAFPDAVPALRRLAASQGRVVRRYAFSNGRLDDVQSLLGHAGLAGALEGVVSLEPARTYKPDPAAYAWFCRQAATAGTQPWLISANPFDVLGALACGWQAAWIRRSRDAVFDPWGVPPSATFSDLGELADGFLR